MLFQRIIVIALSLTLLPGCATMLKGYYSNVELQNAPDSLHVFTADGVELEVTKAVSHVRSDSRTWVEKPVSIVQIRSKYDPVLVLRYQGQEKRVQTFGKIGAGWLVLSTVCGFVPAAVDAVTGCWNTFEPIDAGFR
jgi:hypothetical protein